MPRSSVLLTPTPIDANTVATAAGVVWARGDGLDPDRDAFTLRPLDDGAVLQVLATGTVVLSVLRPRLLPTAAEVARLLPSANADPAMAKWWTDAYTPWHPGGAIGVAILDAMVATTGGGVVHQGLARPVDPRRTE
ncbi:hypothetical protein AB1K54_15905 [Microbacterium sp. BWT-B31]|uniref:hypothetical protein n=1 Tax=Microbacterium sp. BWT-B31 TaxID=3232072 RepID=UPI00352922FF